MSSCSLSASVRRIPVWPSNRGIQGQVRQDWCPILGSNCRGQWSRWDMMDLGSPYSVLHANLPAQSPSHPAIRSSGYQYWYPTNPNVTSGHGVDRACQKPPAPKRCDSPQACCGYTHQHREISSACCLEVLVARQLARSKGTTSIRRTEAAPHSGSSDGEKWPLQHTVESMNDRTVAGGPPRRDRLVPLETGVSEGRAFTAGPESTPLLWCVAHSSSRLDGTKHPGRIGFEVTRRIIGIERRAFRCFSSLEVEGSKLAKRGWGAPMPFPVPVPATTPETNPTNRQGLGPSRCQRKQKRNKSTTVCVACRTHDRPCVIDWDLWSADSHRADSSEANNQFSEIERPSWIGPKQRDS
jgi:hypothetical protein